MLCLIAGLATACQPSAKVGPTVCSAVHGESLQPSATSPAPGQVDISGRTRLGKGSFYASWFAHRQMADGNRMDPKGNNAASRTLPLGTTAKVTNLATGRSAIVSIEDRGPYARGRIIDLSPGTARQIGLTHRAGIARVAVAPISVPLPDGTVMPGVAAPHEASCHPTREG
ncbi:MAG TPA: septal ring lytic transglycosylase RlpA family protein [Steroidobacteraceae bacterium]|nr:septal ring lytic transglycosylase RlpA family protein [Steroidobacteraceae bacterium]